MLIPGPKSRVKPFWNPVPWIIKFVESRDKEGSILSGCIPVTVREEGRGSSARLAAKESAKKKKKDKTIILFIFILLLKWVLMGALLYYIINAVKKQGACAGSVHGKHFDDIILSFLSI
jgi:hypothetical protein